MEWPQIQTTIVEGNALSTVIDAPWVSVTSVNGQTGDVITEPVMQDFQANHFYFSNTIINHGGMLYWAKENFTSGDYFDASNWNTLEIDSVSVLTGQLQKAAYSRSIIALCRVSTADNSNLSSYSSGTFSFHQLNGESGVVEISIQAENEYSTAYEFNYGYYSNLNHLGGVEDIDISKGFRPCVFKYNDVWYGGIELFIENNNYSEITFSGAGDFKVFGLDYYSVAHDSAQGSVLNQEVYDSLDFSKGILARPNFIVNSLRIESGSIRKGDYMVNVPDKSGVIALVSEIPTKTSDLMNDNDFASKNEIYPVGSIYKTTDLATVEQVMAQLGGTWISWGAEHYLKDNATEQNPYLTVHVYKRTA